VNPEWPLVMREHIKNAELVVPPDSFFEIAAKSGSKPGPARILGFMLRGLSNSFNPDHGIPLLTVVQACIHKKMNGHVLPRSLHT